MVFLVENYDVLVVHALVFEFPFVVALVGVVDGVVAVDCLYVEGCAWSPSCDSESYLVWIAQLVVFHRLLLSASLTFVLYAPVDFHQQDC